MARLPVTATKAERQEVHEAKMAGKIIDRARLAGRVTAPRTKAQLRKVYGIGSIAQLNRHTGKPHEHKQEIARRADQAQIRAGTHPWRGQNPKIATA